MSILGDAMDLPRALGPYMLLRRLAVGGMAEVYVAKTRGIGGFEKLVAIKVIHPRFSEDDHFIHMLVEEAKISVLLTHVNIAQIFDLGCIDGTYFIVMEYIEGADTYRILRRTSDRNLALPFDICAYIMSEVCNGLDHAHRKRDQNGKPLGIVHRDVSPQNVLVSHAGEVKIVDFGIAKAALRSGQTEAGVIKGKYYYMSPEQAWGDPMDHRSDIFSTGVVLYELVTGEMLYREDNVPLLLDKVRKAEIEPPDRRRKDIPKELSAIIMKALRRRADDRFQSAHEMGQALTQFLYKISPSFTAARVAELMSEVFPEEARRVNEPPPPSLAGEPLPPPKQSDQPPALPPMSREEFQRDPTKSVIFDLSGGDLAEDRTRTDVSIAKVMMSARAPTGGRSAGDSTAVLSAKNLRREDETRPLPAIAGKLAAHEERTAVSEEADDDDESREDWVDSTVVSGEVQGAPSGWDDEDEMTMVDEDADLVRKAQELFRKRAKAASTPSGSGDSTRVSDSPSRRPPSEEAPQPPAKGSIASQELARRRADGRSRPPPSVAQPQSPRAADPNGANRAPTRRDGNGQARRSERPPKPPQQTGAAAPSQERAPRSGTAAIDARAAAPGSSRPKAPEASRRPNDPPRPAAAPGSLAGAKPARPTETRPRKSSDAVSSGSAAVPKSGSASSEPRSTEASSEGRASARGYVPGKPPAGGSKAAPTAAARPAAAPARSATGAAPAVRPPAAAMPAPSKPLAAVPAPTPTATQAMRQAPSGPPPASMPPPGTMPPRSAPPVPAASISAAPVASKPPSNPPASVAPAQVAPAAIPPPATGTVPPGSAPPMAGTLPPYVPASAPPGTMPPSAPPGGYYASFGPPAAGAPPIAVPQNAPLPGLAPAAVQPQFAAPAAAPIAPASPDPNATPVARPADPFVLPPSQVNTADIAMPKQRTWLKVLGVLFFLATVGAVVGYLVVPKAPPLVTEVIVNSRPTGAMVKLNGTAVPGRTPLTLRDNLVAGQSYEVEVTMPAYAPTKRSIVIQPALVAQSQMFVLSALPATLLIETDPPGARIFIDGIEVGTSPHTEENVTVGRRLSVRAAMQGRNDATQSLDITRDNLRPSIRLVLEEQQRRRRRNR